MHRNVKRANVLWSRRTRQLRLIDFEGSCAVANGAVLPRFGNTSYRAPEVVAAKPLSLDRYSRASPPPPAVWVHNPLDNALTPAVAVGPKADVFSAGLCIAELLLGKRRMLDSRRLGDSYEALRRALRSAAADPLSAFKRQMDARRGRRGEAAQRARMTPCAADLLCRLLAWEPDERPDAAEALAHPYFAAAAADEEVEDDRFYAAVRCEAEARRRRRRTRRRELSRLV